ncbi:MAG: hypothetical protein QOC82_2337 [Frankiaceae bacterium]|nr:hypothetical protein [Frankiaceae bacterium]
MTSFGTATPYAAYVATLEGLAEDVRAGRADPRKLAAALDGEAAAEVRRLLPLDYRREVGAFFTNSSVRAIVTALLREHGRPPYFDAACGAGDLLLAAAETLPRPVATPELLLAWSTALRGTDLHPEFVAATRARLWLAAVAGTPASGGVPDPKMAFAGVGTGDGIDALRACAPPPQTVVLNPPFGAEPALAKCSWGTGMVPRAGRFTEQVVIAMRPGTTLVAVLPDVLRTGARLARWRAVIEQHLDIREVRRIGLFDAHTAVDVFALVGVRRSAPAATQSPVAWWPGATATRRAATVGDRFEVNVGAVVDNRDAHVGPIRAFVVARGLPSGGRVTRIAGRRRFAGRVFAPPFVLVRRTNAPSRGLPRARGVLVTGKRRVAVDNHLLVLSPRSGQLADCEELLDVLERPATTTWLNERIRCRHLTVGALREVRWG